MKRERTTKVRKMTLPPVFKGIRLFRKMKYRRLIPRNRTGGKDENMHTSFGKVQTTIRS